MLSARVSSPHSWGESPRSLTHLMEKRRKLRLLLSCQDRCKVGGGRSNLPTASYVHQNPADLHFPRCLRRTFESLYDNENVVFPLSSDQFCTGFRTTSNAPITEVFAATLVTAVAAIPIHFRFFMRRCHGKRCNFRHWLSSVFCPAGGAVIPRILRCLVFVAHPWACHAIQQICRRIIRPSLAA